MQINVLFEVYKSICKIILPNTLGTGFFIKLEKKNLPFYGILTCEHVIPEELIYSKKTIEVLYNNQKERLKITLNKNERFIRCYKYMNIDATIIEIIPKDNIDKNYFLLPNLEYLNGYEQFIGQEIYIPQYPRGKE